MPVSPFLAFTATAASGATYCSFDVGGAYDAYTLVIPAMTSGTTLNLEVSDTADGTYYPMYLPQSLTSAPVAVEYASSITGCAIQLPNGIGQYFRIKRVATPTATASTFKVLCKGT